MSSPCKSRSLQGPASWPYSSRGRVSVQGLVAGDQQFHGDQDDDDHFQAKRALGVENVAQHLRRISDHSELAEQCIGALLELVFVLKPRIEPFEIGSVPQHVRL